MKNILALCLAVAACIGMLAGCGTAGNGSANTRTITDGADRQVEVPEKVESIVCVGVGALRYTCYMGAQMRARVWKAFSEIKEDTCVITHGGVNAAIMEKLFPEEGKNRYQWQPSPGRGYKLTCQGYRSIPE